MSATGLQQVPELPLPHLTHLNLSHNDLHTVRQRAFQSLTKLLVLDLSSNKLFKVSISKLIPYEIFL